MKQAIFLIPPGWRLCALVCCLALRVSADQVEMKNGDRYTGKVVALDSETLVVENEVLGTLRLPRPKVASISFVAPAKPSPATAGTNAPAAAPNGLAARLSANSHLVDRVQKQFIAGAGPEAEAKFNELLSGLLSGKLTVDDLRAQARATAEQVRAVRKDMDDSAGLAIDGYLAILDRFLGEAPSAVKAGTNAPARISGLPDLLEEP